jgi:hypothetical protein
MHLQLPFIASLLRLLEMKHDGLLALDNHIISTLPLDSLRQSLRVRVVEGSFSKDGSPLSLALRGVITSRQSAVRHDSVVPECDAARLPFPAHGQVVCRMQVLTEEVQSVNAFLPFELGDMDNKERVVEERLEVRDGMSADLVHSLVLLVSLSEGIHTNGCWRRTGGRRGLPPPLIEFTKMASEL